MSVVNQFKTEMSQQLFDELPTDSNQTDKPAEIIRADK